MRGEGSKEGETQTVCQLLQSLNAEMCLCILTTHECTSHTSTLRYAVPNPYEQLKAFTRGQQVTQKSMMEFVDGIEGLPAHAKEELKKLTPSNYIGNAVSQASNVMKVL